LGIHDSNAAGHTVSQSIKDAISTMPTPQFHQRSLDPTRVAPAPQYYPELTPTDLAWINSNSITKVKMTTMIGKQELDAWKLFASTSSVQIAKWEQSIGELEATCKLLEDAHGTSARFDEFAQEATSVRTGPVWAGMGSFPIPAQSKGNTGPALLGWSIR
jgi:hypothetical protein